MFCALSDDVNEDGFVAYAAAVNDQLDKWIGQQVVERLCVFGEFGLVPEGFEREHFCGEAIIRAMFLRLNFSKIAAPKQERYKEEDRGRKTQRSRSAETWCKKLAQHAITARENL